MVLPLLAQAAVKSAMRVSTAWLAEHLRDANLVILHVGQARTGYDANHIPGARFVAFSDIAAPRDGISNELPAVDALKAVFEKAGVSDGSRVILYAEGSVLPATRAYFTLDYLGHGDRTALLDGGIDQWTKENRPLTKEVPQVAAGRFTPRVRPEVLASMADVQRQTASPSPKVSLLDVRAANEYADRGHIPTALNANWTDSQVAGSMALKSEVDLRKLFELAGVKPGSTVVTYCNSGMQSSQSYFTLKYLGYDVKMFDGSLSEWNLKSGALVK